MSTKNADSKLARQKSSQKTEDLIEYLEKTKKRRDNYDKGFNEIISRFDKKKEEKGLKIMTPNQLLTRLPILLAQK